jgi:pectate lyase
MLEQTGRYEEENTARDAMIVTGDSFTDARLDVYAYATSGLPVGVVLRSSENSYYQLRMHVRAADTQPKAVLYLVTPDGEAQLGASQTWAGYTPAAWHRVTATAQGTKITVQIDGVNVLSATDDTLASGRFGLFATADGTAKFDNFRLVRP